MTAKSQKIGNEGASKNGRAILFPQEEYERDRESGRRPDRGCVAVLKSKCKAKLGNKSIDYSKYAAGNEWLFLKCLEFHDLPVFPKIEVNSN